MAWSASSDWQRWDPDQYLICPYDISHRILASRFQRHLVKCRANYPDKDFVSCPFNASHQILRPHLRNHICSCPDKNVVEPAYNSYSKDEQFYYLKGDTSVPSYYSSNLEDEPEEDWDKEIIEDEPETLSSVNSVKNIAPVQFKSVMSQTREEFKREMKQKALADKATQRLCNKISHSNNLCGNNEATQDVGTELGNNNMYNPKSQELKKGGRLIQEVYEKNCGGIHTNKMYR